MSKFTVNDLKSLASTISGVVQPVEEKNTTVAFTNSLTEKARQVNEAEEKKEPAAHEKAEKSGHEVGELVKKLAAKALKRAKKKAATNEEVELAEKAAPGYEDWASDPKVKASFKKQYGNRWKQVMYGHSWNMKKMNEETKQLDEISDTLLFRARAKAKGVGKFKVRTNPSFAGSSKDVPLHKKITKELQRRGSVPVSESEQFDEEWGGGFQSFKDAHREVQAGLRREASANRRKLVADIKAVFSGKMTKNAFTRKHKIKFGEHTLAKRMAASRAKAKAKYLAKKAAKASATKADSTPSIMEGMQLDEAGYKRLMRLKKAAYTAQDKAHRSFTADQNKPAKLARAAAEREAQVAAGMARRGGASPDAVRGGGSRIGKSGKYTQKAGALANQRDKALAKFRSRAGYNKAQGMSRSSTEKQISRNTQQFQDDIRNRSRSGDFGQDNQAALRARSNFQKRFGRLKGK